MDIEPIEPVEAAEEAFEAPQARRRPLVAIVAGVGIVALVALIAVGAWGLQAGPRGRPLFTLQVSDPAAATRLDLDDLHHVLEGRLRSAGVRDGTATVAEDGSIEVHGDVPASSPLELNGVRDLLRAPGHVAFVATDAGATPGQVLDMDSVDPLFTGERVIDGSVEPGPDGRTSIALSLDEAGTELLADYTSTGVGNALAITVDGRIIVAPIINEPIVRGEVQITSGGPDHFSVQEDALLLLAVLRNGPLPVAVE